VEAVDLDHLLGDLHGDMRYDVLVEPGVVLFLGFPELRHAEAIRVGVPDVE